MAERKEFRTHAEAAEYLIHRGYWPIPGELGCWTSKDGEIDARIMRSPSGEYLIQYLFEA